MDLGIIWLQRARDVLYIVIKSNKKGEASADFFAGPSFFDMLHPSLAAALSARSHAMTRDRMLRCKIG